jgi:DNA-binding response OmpR family regulator
MASIVLAEDNSSLLRLLDSVLTAAGHEVLMAADTINGADIPKITDKPIDLLCTHLALGRTSGAVLAERLRERYPEMKVLFMITENPRYVGVETPEVCGHDSKYCVIRKPFTVRQLMAKIQDMLNAGAHSATTPGAPA